MPHILSSSTEPLNSTPSPRWRGLRFFNAYRLVVATLLLGAHAFLHAQRTSHVFSAEDFDLFTLLAGIYAILALILFAIDELRPGRYSLRLQLGLAIDLIFLAILGALDDSPINNLHILMVINMAYASLLLGGRESMAYAALGSLLLLAMNFWDHRLGIDFGISFTHAGLNGLALFAVALLARGMAQRATTNQQLAEQRGIDLANETQLNRLILEQSHEGVIVIDAQHCIRHANPAATRLLRLQRENTGENELSRPPLAHINPDLNAALLAWRQTPDDDLSETHITYPMRLHARIRPLTDDPQGPVALFVEDDFYLMEKLQQEKLAAMGRLTASIAHEIRNPLSAIGQAGQLLEETAQNAQEKQLLGIVRSQVERINQLVENVLTTAKRKRAQPEILRLAPWLRELIERYKSYAKLDDAQIDITADPSLCARVDPRHLEQMLVILLDNARQHGKPSIGNQRIRIDAHTFGAQKRSRIEVRDNGTGVPDEMRHRLFEPFFSTHAQGHGLGLFIARELAEANQLTLNYHHEVHGDRCFRITFPRQEFCREAPLGKI
jgi:two-component system sensor histidine kinase PilS (NtrC family)